MFSQWAKLATDDWTLRHRNLFALALMHYFSEAKSKRLPVPDAVRAVGELLGTHSSPLLNRPSNDEVKAVFLI